MTTPGQQFAVGSGLDNAAGIEHDDLVGVFHGRKSVRDDQRCAVLHDLLQRFLDGAFRFGEVDSIRALLCVAKFDPVKSRKAMRRKIPGEKKARKWRSRIKRGEIQLRVEDVKKKKKKTRRKIESAFKKLKK